MQEQKKWGMGGMPVLILIGASSLLAWLFANPFMGFMIVMAVGITVLAIIEHVQGRNNPPRPDDTAME